MTTMQVIGALCMMLSGASVGVLCTMGRMRRYGWEHRSVVRSAPMAVFAGILFTRGMTAIHGVQPLTPWGEAVAVIGACWYVSEVVHRVVRGWRQEGLRATLGGVMSAPVPKWTALRRH